MQKEIPEVGSPAHSHHMLPAAEGVVPVVEEGHMLHNLHTHHSLPAIKYATPNQNKEHTERTETSKYTFHHITPDG
jgi:hypothetical protein